MPSRTTSNKQIQLLFSPDPASLECSIRKESRSSLIDNNTCLLLDFVQPPSTHTLVSSTDTRSPPSTEDTHLPSTDIVHSTSINTPVRTSTDTEPRDMVATLILVRDERGDLHDQEGHLRNAAVELDSKVRGTGFQGSGNQGGNRNSYGNRGREAARRGFQSRKFDEFWWITLVSIDAKPRTSIDRGHPKSIDVLFRTSLDNTYGINRILQSHGYARAIDRHTLHVSREDIADILLTANGADNLLIHQRNIPEHQQKATKEFYDTAGGIDKRFKQRTRHPTQPSIDVDAPTSVDRRPEFGRRAFDLLGTRRFYWEEKDEYGIYINDQGYARDLDGHTIRVHNRDIRRLLE
ncbi:hypothetical protein F2Q69_00012993 [Brassica cretica]|uniref:Uncharacterized protein n=1 Tax=Brassica cretica TaxID=69181 RepID=A0A8S9R0X7_BRACR|nr:hypothetical protein F2Q69_00012993 [Brassica cretica]